MPLEDVLQTELRHPRVTGAAADRAVEVEDQVGGLRRDEVVVVEHVERLEDHLYPVAAEGEELGGADVQRQELVVLAPRLRCVTLPSASIRADGVAAISPVSVSDTGVAERYENRELKLTSPGSRVTT